MGAQRARLGHPGLEVIAGWQHVDVAGLVMRTELLVRRPDVALAWLRAELEAQRFLDAARPPGRCRPA